MARGEVSQAIVSADWLDIRHVTLAAEVAGSCQIHLERLHALRCVVVVGDRRAGHFHVITTEEEEKRITSQADDVRDEHELNCTLRFELESFKEATSNEDSDAGPWDGDGSGEYARLTLPQAELRLEVLRQENHETADDHELHASAETRYNVDRVRNQAPHRQRNVCNKSALAVTSLAQ